MGSKLNLSLTDELREFIDQNCGDGTLDATPSEFVRDVLRQKKRPQEAAAARDAIIEGFHDAIADRGVAFERDLLGLAHGRDLEQAPGAHARLNSTVGNH